MNYLMVRPQLKIHVIDFESKILWPLCQTKAPFTAFSGDKLAYFLMYFDNKRHGFEWTYAKYLTETEELLFVGPVDLKKSFSAQFPEVGGIVVREIIDNGQESIRRLVSGDTDSKKDNNT